MPHAHNGHDHSHTPTVTNANERKVLLSFFLISGFMVVEVVGGLLSGSLALLADAGHMLTDSAALALAYAAFRAGRRVADSRRTFGYLRLGVIAAFVNALTLFGIVGWIFYEAVQRLRQPGEVLAGPMMMVAVAGLLINILVLWIMTRGETRDVNIRGAILHVMGDLLGSVGAIVAAISISITGWTPIDPILSVVVAALILRAAWPLMAESVHILLEGAPDHAAPDEIEQALLAAVPDLAAVGHIHLWQITSDRAMATLTVRPADDSKAKSVSRKVADFLKSEFGIDHSTVAIDWNDGIRDRCSLNPALAVHHHGHPHTGHAH
ncbi:MAG: cation diffusion facilitator family transporter [Pseudotabrizicola sp.]|uniref:cation diffusion facilitator family transporter n=1 Tax=Pseudotabrizicola sp. TaxID=2939647 RepID=UPI0027214794|nr:cation diffusion facilitator family transporter [Pseudotabrizicola sp.]MDO9638373.1 cation diffusion facilitator family transporter [Pseudotabrizicola sp.]